MGAIGTYLLFISLAYGKIGFLIPQFQKPIDDVKRGLTV